MKKTKGFIALLVSVCILTGCGKNEDSTEILKASEKKMNELSSYAMKMEMTLGMKAEGMELTVPIVADIKVDEKSGNSQMKTSTKMMGQEIATEGYAQILDGKTTTYTKGTYELDGEKIWMKETNDEKTDYMEFVSIIKNNTKIQKKKSDDKKANLYQITVSKDQMKELLKNSSSVMGEMDAESADIKGDVVVDVYVDKSSDYITKIVMDLKDTISMEEEDVEMEITSYTISITFSEFNKVGTITIPEEVINTAKDQSSDDWYMDDDLEENDDI